MFLLFSVISLPCNFCQIQPALELDSPSTTEITGTNGEYIFAPPHSPFQNYAPFTSHAIWTIMSGQSRKSGHSCTFRSKSGSFQHNLSWKIRDLMSCSSMGGGGRGGTDINWYHPLPVLCFLFFVQTGSRYR